MKRTMVLAAIAAILLTALIALLTVMLASRNPPSPLVANLTEVKHFELVDTQGKTVTPANFSGEWALLFFGFTRCPDICPTTLIDVGQVLERLGPKAQKIQPIFITVDPEWDTQERLASYMENFDRRIVGLTGSMEQVREAARNYGVFFRKSPLDGGEYTIDHSAALYLLDPNGVYVRPYSWQDGVDVLVEKLNEVLSQ